MRWWNELEARDALEARRATTFLALVPAAVLALMTATWQAPGDVKANHQLGINVGYSVVIALVIFVVIVRLLPARTTLVLLGAPINVVFCFLITLVNVISQDASASAQIFMVYPVVFAAYMIRPLGAYVVCGSAVVSVALGLQLVAHAQHKLSDLVAISAALITVTVLLVRARQSQEDATRRLEQRAKIDHLTGLASRQVLGEALQDHSDRICSLILLDVDHFKQINDTYGHPVGDAALVHIAELLRRSVRPTDVVGRIGGDELAVLMPGCPPDIARLRAEELLDNVRTSPLQHQDMFIELSVSIGVAQGTEGYEDLYQAADAALYRAKRAGRGRVGVLTDVDG